MSELVYRLEMIEKCSPKAKNVNIGVYRQQAGLCGFEFTGGYTTDNDASHPSPYDDSKLSTTWNDLICDSESEEYYFGFSNIEQLKRWFYNDNALKEAIKKVQIGVYECETVHHGYTQAIFKATTAKRIRALPANATSDQELLL